MFCPSWNVEEEQLICFLFLYAFWGANNHLSPAMENAVLEPRSERIARYKAERRRELAERYGSIDELPSKWVRRDEKKVHEPASQAYGGTLNSHGLSEKMNSRTQEVSNGLEAPAESDCLRRWAMSGVNDGFIECLEDLHINHSSLSLFYFRITGI